MGYYTLVADSFMMVHMLIINNVSIVQMRKCLLTGEFLSLLQTHSNIASKLDFLERVMSFFVTPNPFLVDEIYLNRNCSL